MVSPIAAGEGEKEVMIGRGGGIKVKPDKVLVPNFDLTEIIPDEPERTTALILVDDSILNERAGIPPIDTSVTSDRLVPAIVNVSPVVAEVGVKPVMAGGGINENPGRLLMLTVTSPVAPLPTTAVTVLASMILNEAAAVPPKLTERVLLSDSP